MMGNLVEGVRVVFVDFILRNGRKKQANKQLEAGGIFELKQEESVVCFGVEKERKRGMECTWVYIGKWFIKCLINLSQKNAQS